MILCLSTVEVEEKFVCSREAAGDEINSKSTTEPEKELSNSKKQIERSYQVRILSYNHLINPMYWLH